MTIVFHLAMLRCRLPRPRLAVISSVGVLGIFCLSTPLCRSAAAQSLLFSFSGTFDPNASFNGGYAFDGTDYTELPPLMDLASLEGGTFAAQFTVPATLIPSSETGKVSTYNFDSASSVQFTLFDATGHARYQSSGWASFVQGRVYRFPYIGSTANQIVYASLNGFNVVGVTPPPGTSNELLGGPFAQFNFANYTNPANTPLSDFSFPTDPATYLSFPERQFILEVFYGDGDLENGVEPYRFFDTTAIYTVNSVRITAVPEPGSLGLLAGLAVPAALVLCRRHARRHTTARWRVSLRMW